MKLYTVVTKNFEDINKLKTTNSLNACVCSKRIFKLSDTAWIIIIGMHQNRVLSRFFICQLPIKWYEGIHVVGKKRSWKLESSR